MDATRYFDHAATTPVDPRVLREMIPFFTEDFGNAHSLHALGRKAHAAVELARERVAALLGAEDPSQITFNSGATEGNNTILRSFPDAVISPFEHSSLREPAKELDIPILQNEAHELSPLDSVHELLCVMAVNNETGTIWKPQSLRGSAKLLHSDMTQAVGKLPIDLAGLDFVTLSAHKFYGPKGIGALYSAEFPPSPLLRGGDQENGARGGTLNVPGIVGMGVAAAIAMDEMERDYVHASQLKSTLLDGLSKVSDFRINGGTTNSPYILSVSFFGLQGETLTLEADHSTYAISSGAACSSLSTAPSPVLRAMGSEDSFNRGTVRISFGRANTLGSAAGLAACLQYSVEKLRTMT